MQCSRGRVSPQHFNSLLKQQQQQQTSDKMLTSQKYDYFLVLDFEATCDKGKRIKPQEIIEFPVLKVNAKTYQEESKFRQFVRPTHNPKLTDFCTELTKIQQEDVNKAKPFEEVFEDFKQWMENDVGLDKEFLFVTCGNWDLQTMLPSQCTLCNIPVPYYCKTWLNIKKSYAIKKKEYVNGMLPMLEGLNLTHEGVLHSGLDDCRNIAKILKALADLNCRFLPTYSIE
ncbi:ERI1 exoribonuclease 3-like [Eriocheir sinensis]|uniref:ERI1 exoribonuclease 3-like n=1 Tax=Eriocheir sinensis TaxID=95602 RepID=UPI0021CAB6C6|nr:ERI1 exoribonuclease 3-like [Eriocheir sinensis]